MKKRINLLYSEKRASSYIKLPFLKKSLFTTAMAGFVILCIVVTIYQIIAIKVYSGDLKKTQKNFEIVKNDFTNNKSKLDKIKKEKEELRKDKIRLDEKIVALNELSEGSVALSKYLVGIVSLVPEDLWIKGIVLDYEGMKIRGATLSHQNISDFMIKLDKSKIFKDTSFNFTERSETQKKEKVIDFEIVTHLVM